MIWLCTHSCRNQLNVIWKGRKGVLSYFYRKQLKNVGGHFHEISDIRNDFKKLRNNTILDEIDI